MQYTIKHDSNMHARPWELLLQIVAFNYTINFLLGVFSNMDNRAQIGK